MTEEQIVNACLNGDSAAQRELYDRFAGKMMSLCLRYASDRDEAEDMLQEGFIRVFNKLDQFRSEGSLAGWIRKVIVNTALIQIRKNKRWNHKEELDGNEELNESSFGVLDSMAADELFDLVKSMPPGYRTVFHFQWPQ